MRVSIVINNYNYGRFLNECIDSALNQTYRSIEVIVVDDGSTDNSREIIASYGNRVSPILKQNGGQGSAYNAGFSMAKGDIVLFLDSDDYLFQDTVERIVAAWRPGLSKVHFRLQMVDDQGVLLGIDMPNFLHSGDVKGIIEKFGSYASPPGSGNAFARHSLDKLFPMPEAEWRIAADTYPIFLAPYFGDVATLDGIGGGYRIHKKKGGEEKFVLNNNPSTPGASVARTYQSRQLIFEALRRLGLIDNRGFRYEAPAQVKIRLISLRIDRVSHPLENDAVFKVLWAGLLAILKWPDYPLRTRVGYALWMVGVAFLPQALAEKMILLAISNENRPRLALWLLGR